MNHKETMAMDGIQRRKDKGKGKELRIQDSWLPSNLTSGEMDSDEEHIQEGTIHSAVIITDVNLSTRQRYESFSVQRKPVLSLSSPSVLEQKYNQLLSLRIRKELELTQLQRKLSDFQVEFHAFSDGKLTAEYDETKKRLNSVLKDTADIIADTDSYEFLLFRTQLHTSILQTRASRLKKTFSNIENRVKTALNVIQIDENWTLSFVQQQRLIESYIRSMRNQRVAALSEMLSTAEFARSEVIRQKSNWITDRIREIRGKDRREKLIEQVQHETQVKTQAERLRKETRTILDHHQALNNRFSAVFQTVESDEIVEKFQDVMGESERLQKTVEEILVSEAKLRSEYLTLRREREGLIQTRGLPYKAKKDGIRCGNNLGNDRESGECNEIAPGTDLVLLYRWLSNVGGILTQVGRMDYEGLWGPMISFPMTFIGESDGNGVDFAREISQICILLQKKLISAIEITFQKWQVRPKKRKMTGRELLQSAMSFSIEERLRIKMIQDHHFIVNPSKQVQGLISSYASTVQRGISLKSKPMNPSNPSLKQLAKAQESAKIEWEKTDQTEQAFFLAEQTTAKGKKTSFPPLESMKEKQALDSGKTARTRSQLEFHSPRELVTDRGCDEELKEYVTSRTREMRKSGSTEGLMDFLRDVQVRKRELARFIDKHKVHLRAFSLAWEKTEGGGGGGHKKTLSSMASTCASPQKGGDTYNVLGKGKMPQRKMILEVPEPK